MNYKEVIPIRLLRKFDVLCQKNKVLNQNIELQQQILDWTFEVLIEAREEWKEIHATMIEAVVKMRNKEKARKGAAARDKKYMMFRDKFAEIQKEKYLEKLQTGSKLTANNFVKWFLVNKASEISIPYVKQNQKNKLIQLAQANNRKLKKLLPS